MELLDDVRLILWKCHVGVVELVALRGRKADRQTGRQTALFSALYRFSRIILYSIAMVTSISIDSYLV